MSKATNAEERYRELIPATGIGVQAYSGRSSDLAKSALIMVII